MDRETSLIIIRRRKFITSHSLFRNPVKMEVSAVLLFSPIMWKDQKRQDSKTAESGILEAKYCFLYLLCTLFNHSIGELNVCRS